MHMGSWSPVNDSDPAGQGITHKLELSSISTYLVYNTIDDIIQAVKIKEVDGMLLDRYRASYYQSRGTLRSLITVKKLELRKDIGILFSKNNKKLAGCLNFFRSDIWRLVQTRTASLKVMLTFIGF